MSDLMKVYCINLDRRPDRLAHMTEQFERLGVDFVRVPAVDGQDTKVQAEAERLGHERSGQPGGAGTFACFQSHKEIWRTLVKSGDSFAIVLEDDVLVADRIVEYLSVDWIPANAHIVKLETNKNRIHLCATSSTKVPEYPLQRLYSAHLGTGGYIISRKTAQKLLADTKSFDLAVDRYLFSPESKMFSELLIYQMVPAPVIQGDKAKVESDWVKTSITDRQGAPNFCGKRERLLKRTSRRLREEIRAIRQGTRYVVVPFG